MSVQSFTKMEITPEMLKKIGIGVGALLGVLLLVYVIVGQFSEEKRNTRAVNASQEFIDASLASIKADAKFTDVHFSASGDREIFVQGTTQSLAECEDLRSKVQATNPPLTVKYMLTYSAGRGVFEATDEQK
jgi:hypothetical protein